MPGTREGGAKRADVSEVEATSPPYLPIRLPDRPSRLSPSTLKTSSRGAGVREQGSHSSTNSHLPMWCGVAQQPATLTLLINEFAHPYQHPFPISDSTPGPPGNSRFQRRKLFPQRANLRILLLPHSQFRLLRRVEARRGEAVERNESLVIVVTQLSPRRDATNWPAEQAIPTALVTRKVLLRPPHPPRGFATSVTSTR